MKKNLIHIPQKNDNVEEIPDGINVDSLENILWLLCKSVISSGNHVYIIKLLAALMKNLTKKEDNDISNILTSSGPVEQQSP